MSSFVCLTSFLLWHLERGRKTPSALSNRPFNTGTDAFRVSPPLGTLHTHTDALNIHPANIRAKVRQVFEKNSKVDDLETMDVLLLKGHQEFQETMNVWKMESHVVRHGSLLCTTLQSRVH